MRAAASSSRKAQRHAGLRWGTDSRRRQAVSIKGRPFGIISSLNAQLLEAAACAPASKPGRFAPSQSVRSEKDKMPFHRGAGLADGLLTSKLKDQTQAAVGTGQASGGHALSVRAARPAFQVKCWLAGSSVNQL